mgnify:FL=1
MRVEDVKRQALMLLQEWFNNGQKQPEGDIADYLYSMDDFIDTAQKQIAAKYPIYDTFEIIQESNSLDFINRYKLPDDYYELDKIIYEDEGIYREFHDFRWEGNNILVLPEIEGKFIVHYKKMPATIQFDEDDVRKNNNTELEIDISVQHLVPIYCAAMTILPEEPTIGTMKLNEYYGLLNGLSTPSQPGVSTIKNILGW